jgi:hypothetical protein
MQKIPYWRQTSPASCGPSCLLMLFNHIKPSYGLSREKEWEIWRDTSLLTWRGSHPYGLAIASLKRGFGVKLFREKCTVWKDSNFPDTNESLKYAIEEQEKTAKLFGLDEEIEKDIDMKFLKSLADRGTNPIILMMMVEKNKKMGFLHWVVVTKIDEKFVTIQDPEVSSDRRIPTKLFVKAWDAVRNPKWGTSKEVMLIGV